MKIVKNEYALCVPLTGKNIKTLKNEINDGKAYRFFEWRRDYFITEDCNEERKILKKINNQKKGFIYTFRSDREGGVSTCSDQDRLDTIIEAIKTGLMDYIDIEINNESFFLEEINKNIKKTSVKKICSYHNFNETPPDRIIIDLFDQMLKNEADVIKIAFRPRSENDLRRLIRLNLDYGQKLDQPIILIAMGELGKITRIAPEICGGSLSYASGNKKTAPGQLDIEEIEKIRKHLGLK